MIKLALLVCIYSMHEILLEVISAKYSLKLALSFYFLIYCLCCIYMMINCGRINYFAGACFLLVEYVLVMLFLLLSPHGSDALLQRLGCSLSLTRFYFLVP